MDKMSKRTSFIPSPIPPKGLPPLTPSPVRIKPVKKSKTKSKTKTISELPALARVPRSVPRSPVVRKQTLSGNKDADLMILSILNDKDLFSLCMVDKYANSLCKVESFWMNRFVNRFGDIAAKYKPENRTWRNHYLKVVSDIDLTDPWSFLSDISWVITNPPKSTNVHINFDELVKKSSETNKNLYWMLELGKDITLEFPVDRYGDIDYVKRRYKSDKEFTPAKVLQLVYDFYQEPVSRKELEMMQEKEVEFADEFELEDAVEGKVKRIDLMGGLQFFEGFTKEGNAYNLSLGS